MSSSCAICNNSMAEVRRLRDRVEALEWFVECYDVESQNISQTYEAYIEMLASLDAAREAIR